MGACTALDVAAQNAKSSAASKSRVPAKIKTRQPRRSERDEKLPVLRAQKIEIKAGKMIRPASMDRDLSALPRVVPSAKEKYEVDFEREPPPLREKKSLPGLLEAPNIQAEQPENVLSPAPSVSFDGLDFATWGSGWPPDTVGDVGPNHYIQAVNSSVGIYSKTGTQLAAFTFSTMWTGAGTGTLCDTTHRGDPTVVYDPQNDRWIVADFAFTGGGTTAPFFECIAVSKTSNPVSGGWWLYAIRTDDATHPWFADYPKMGVWRDALLMSANMYNSTLNFQAVRLWAFRLSDMINGLPVTSRIVDPGTSAYFGMLPANYRGTPPPVGTDALFISESQTLFAFEVFKFHIDFVGAASTFTGPTNVSQTSYSVATATVPSSGNSLDSVRERLMMQAQYRNISGIESIWVNHTVRSGASPAPNGIQWAQLNVTGGTIATTPVQQQIYGNLSGDLLNRWMGSLAVDRLGNMALAYSTSRSTINPGISYNGRLAGDPLGTLPQGEVVLQAGGGGQTGNCGGSPCQRWGDYSAMSVDPVDDCTFWYTTEYLSTSGLNWKTRIAAFAFPGCAAPTAANASITGRVTTYEGLAISGAFVTISDADGNQRTTRTNVFGNFQFNEVSVGQTYVLTVSNNRYSFKENTKVVSVTDNVSGISFVADPQ
jgi:hypothetical protein